MPTRSNPTTGNTDGICNQDRWAINPAHPTTNPDIANALFRAGKIVSWGRGIDLIRNRCLEEGYPAPRFSCDSTGLWIEFTFPKVSSVNTGDGVGDSPQALILRIIKAKPTISIQNYSQVNTCNTKYIKSYSSDTPA